MSSRQTSPIKPQVYRDERPHSYFVPFYAWAREHDIGWSLEIARMLLVPLCMLIYRVRAIDAAQVPGSGAVIIAPNHFSTLDHFFVAMYLRRRVHFMAKSQLFRGPLARILKRLGAFPVQRGQRDEEAIATALSVLRSGGALVIYPEGGRSRSTELGDRARPGVGRLALESGAPVVPVAIHGSQFARNWKRLRFPRIRVRYGEPVRYALSAAQRSSATESPEALRAAQQGVADDLLRRIRALWNDLEQQGRASARVEPVAPAQLPAALAAHARRQAVRVAPVMARFSSLRPRRVRIVHPAERMALVRARLPRSDVLQRSGHALERKARELGARLPSKRP